MARGQLVTVEHDLFRRIEALGAPREDRMFRARLISPVVPVAILVIGDAGIILLHAADDLSIEALLQRLRGRHAQLAVLILGRKVGQYFWIRALVIAHPVIRVLARAP